MRASRFHLLLPTAFVIAGMAACQQVEPPSSPIGEIMFLPTELGPADILISQDYVPGLMRPELFFEFGRISPFTLYVDGTVIYVQEGTTADEEVVMRSQLSEDEMLSLWRQVLETGFDRLQSYTDECQEQPDGTTFCIMDAATTLLQVALPSGELREVRIYADFSNDPQALEAITTLLIDYQHPGEQPYQPAGATLFLRPLEENGDVTIAGWPLDTEWLANLDFGERGMLAIPLRGEALSRYLSAVPRNSGDAYFTVSDRLYGAYLVPWLPSADYTSAIQREYPASQPAQTYPTRFTVCPVLELTRRGALRLAWIENGDLWVWDRGVAEPYSLTGSGDVTAVRLTPDAHAVVFTRQTGAGSELWASSVDATQLRRLTDGIELSGQIEILDFSSELGRLAFIHHLPESGGELWVVNLDGSGSRRLVSHSDLMAIVPEPEAAFATPTGVTWIPNSTVLTYDALPGFVGNEIYSYFQRQVWVVDSNSGLQDAWFPAGEGGQISYSPDGTTVALITPESLQMMNLEAGELHNAGIDYFATGSGDYYVFPPMVWTLDSQALLLVLPINDADSMDQDQPVAIWRVPTDGSPAVLLAELTGFMPSFTFSPDQTKIAFWQVLAPGSNLRQLHVTALDGAEHIVYDTQDTLDFRLWASDSDHFIYEGGTFPGVTRLGSLCEDPRSMELDFYPVNLNWIHATSYLFEQHDGGLFKLFLGLVEAPQTHELVLNLEEFGGYDYAVLQDE